MLLALSFRFARLFVVVRVGGGRVGRDADGQFADFGHHGQMAGLGHVALMLVAVEQIAFIGQVLVGFQLQGAFCDGLAVFGCRSLYG